MHFPKICTSKYLVLFFLSLLLSGKLFSASTNITSSLTINQAWVNANAAPWVISGNDLTVTFGGDLVLNSVNQYFQITGSNVIINGAGKTATIFGVTNYPGLVKASDSYAITPIIKNIGVVIQANSTLLGFSFSFGPPPGPPILILASGWISQASNKANISYCYSTGNIAGNNAGGIVGENNFGSISNCYTTGAISSATGGGITGYYNSGVISNCYSTGNVTGNYAGGIVGRDNQASGVISNCYTIGNINSEGSGGITGSGNYGSISNCYSTGNITGNYAGGIAGPYNRGAIGNCYTSGLISGSSAGGIAGDGNFGNISNNNTSKANGAVWNNTYANSVLTGLTGPNSVWNTTTTPYTLLEPSSSVLTISLPAATLTSCFGSSSISPTTFGVTGSDLTASVTITVPSDFEISTSLAGTYSSSLTLTNTSTVSQTLYVRLISSATAGDKTGTITATSTGASDVTTTVSGTVNALPSISITEIDASGVDPNDGIICNGASATLTASGTTATYLWSTSATNTSITISPSTNTTYTVTGTASGCSNTASITITVNAIPTISITESDVSGSSNNDSKVCIGGLATLTASGGSTYLWSTTDISTSITPSLSSNTTYTVTGTTSGCSNTASITITVESLPTLSLGAISLCTEATYLITKTTSVSNNESWTVSGTITVNNGYVTAGTTPGNFTVSYTDGCAQTVSATVTVAATSTLPAITDGLASYKFNNNPQGPIGSGNVIYMGYNGFNYSSTIRPTNTGFYKANNVSGSSAGSPTQFYIFRCTTCGTVSEYTTRPQGTLSGSTINQGATGQLTYTSSNGGGPFTIVYQATGASPATVNNISSTVAFNIGTPSSTTSYKLISVTDENTKATTDFSETSAIITVNIPHYVGESYGGGIVFYITDGGAHGLIAAPTDQSSGIIWGPNYTITGATGTAIGTGLANTSTIITIQGGTPTSYAAGLARAYNGGGYTNWYLPSKDELNLMYTKIGKGASSPNYNIGNFAPLYYWSSTEYNQNEPWTQEFNNGGQIYFSNLKSYPLYVRAIRSF